MRQLLCSLMIIILILTSQSPAYAYSYGDPGEEPFAKAFINLKMYLDNDNWDEVKVIINTYEKDFKLYFSATKPYIDEALEKKDKELLIESYQAALRLNIERRLFYATEDFENYGRAKMLLAKARGTFDILKPSVQEKEGQQFIQDIYTSFDKALEALGNPGLFGVGSKESDFDQFEQQTQYIIKQLKPLYPIESEGDSHFYDEDIIDEFGESNNPFWLWFTILLVVIFILLVLFKRKR
jgi:LPXTG-motif cell wall-anchored protein